MVKRNPEVELDKGSKDLFLLFLRGRGEVTVEELVGEAVRKLGLKRHEAARAIYKLREAEMIEIIDPSPPRSFLSFLFSSRSTWFWLLIALTVLTDLSIYVFPQHPPIQYVRYVLGSLFVLYLPGASLIELLYPGKRDLSQLERLALSIGLSLALVPLVGLILNYTPWGIRLNPVVASLSFLTVTLALGAVERKHSLHLFIHQRSASSIR